MSNVSVEFENQSTRPAVIFHKKLALGESVSVTDRGSELCNLARRPRELNARAERRAFSLPGGTNGYAAQFTVSIGQGPGGTDVACVIDTTGSNAGKKFKVVVHDLELHLLEGSSGRVRKFRANGEVIDDASDEEDGDFTLRTTLPTAAESRLVCDEMVRCIPGIKDQSKWEVELEDLAVLARKDVKRIMEQADEQAAEPGATQGRTFFQLQLASKTAGIAQKLDVSNPQAIFVQPLATSKIVGKVDQSRVEVFEQKELWVGGEKRVWLRCDKDRWLQQSCAAGRWELSPSTSADELQTDFFVDSALRVLVHMMDNDPGAAAILLECTSQFVQRLQPMALFDSTSPTIDRALQSVIAWLRNRASVANEDDSVAALRILVRLVVARGTLLSVLQLSEFLTGRPELLRDSAIVQELSKLIDVEAFEPAAAAHFDPVPGSTEALVDAWEQQVFGAVADAAGPKTDETLGTLTVLLRDGDEDAALQILRASLPENIFAALQVPKLSSLRLAEYVSAYSATETEVETVLRSVQQQDPGKEDAALYILGLVELLSYRLKTRVGEAPKPARSPVCVDASVETVQALIRILAVEDNVDVVVATSSKQSISVKLLRLLTKNIAVMSAQKASLPADTASQLHALVAKFLAVDLKLHPECSALGEAAAALYAVGQKHFLRTPQAKASTAQEFMLKLVDQPDAQPEPEPEPEIEPEPEPEPEQEGAQLCPAEFLHHHPALSLGSHGSIRLEQSSEHTYRSAIAGNCVMSSGRHFLEVTLAPDSMPPSPDNPQGFQRLVLSVVRPGVDMCEQIMTKAWGYSPVTGDTWAPNTEGGQVEPQRVDWISDEWWRSAGSCCWGDSVGLLLDCSSGSLIAVKNGVELGVIFSGLSGDFNFALSIGAGVHANVSTASGVTVIETLKRMVAPKASVVRSGILDKVTSSLLAEIALPATLQRILNSDASIDSVGLHSATFGLLQHIVKGWQGRPPSAIQNQVSLTQTTTKENAWVWGEHHQSFNVSEDGQTATRNGGGPDYAATIGNTPMVDGIHEWTMKIEQDSDGVWLGVCSPNLPLGRDQNLDNMNSNEARLWWWRSSGFVWQNTGDFGRRRDVPGFVVGQTIKVTLDLSAKTVSFFESPTAAAPVHTLTGVEGPVVPFVYFDYRSRVVLLSATSQVVKPGLPASGLSVGLCAQLCTHSMHLAYDALEASNGQALVTHVLRYARWVMEFIKSHVDDNHPDWAYQVLQSCGLQELLSSALPLASKLILCRRASGKSVGADLLPEIVQTISALQEGFDVAPQMMMDPLHPVRIAARGFANTHSCSRTTAEYYVWSFTDSAEPIVDQAEVEYENAGKAPAPAGFTPPCDQDHWLATMADAMAGLGGKAVGSLCAGLKGEEEFDIQLFQYPHNMTTAQQLQDVILADASAEVSKIDALRQRWIGPPTAVLADVERLTIVAMLMHGELMGAEDSIATRGALLHVGQEALKVKNAVMREYMTQTQAEQPASWDGVAKHSLERAQLLLEYCQGGAATMLPEPKAPDDAVWTWASDSAATDYRCRRIDQVRRFIQTGPDASVVRDIVDARLQAASDAKCGYSAALALLDTGVIHSTGLQRVATTPTTTPMSKSITGSWQLAIDPPKERSADVSLTLHDFHTGQMVLIFSPTEVWRECTILATRRDFGDSNDEDAIQIRYNGFDPQHDEWVSLHRQASRIKPPEPVIGLEGTCELFVRENFVAGTARMPSLCMVTGRADLDDSCETAVLSLSLVNDMSSVCARMKLRVKLDGSLESGTITECSAQSEPRLVTGVLDRPGSRPLHITDANGNTSLHWGLRGLSVTRRRVRLLQALAQVFSDLGTLVEDEVRQSADELSDRVLGILVNDPSIELQYWAARLLLTRLDNDAARHLVASNDGSQMQRVIHLSLYASKASRSREAGNPVQVQSALISSVLITLASATLDYAAALGDLIGMMYTVIRDAKQSRQMEQYLRSLSVCCHNATAREALRSAHWQEFFWSTLESGARTTIRNIVLELLSWTLSPSDANLNKLLLLVTSTSAERVLWQNTADHMAEEPSKATDSLRGRYRCTQQNGVGIRSRPIEDGSSRALGPSVGEEIAVETIVRTTQAGETIDYLQLVAGGFCPMRLPKDTLDYFERVGSLESQDSTPKRSEQILQKNAVLVVRNLIQDNAMWAESFIKTMVQTVSATATAQSDLCKPDPAIQSWPTVWPHVLIMGGLHHVVGVGQPTASGLGNAMATLVRRVLQHPVHDDSISPTFCTLRARILKAVWESIGVDHRLSTYVDCLPLIAKIAQEPTSVPANASIEALLAKSRSLYACTLSFAPKDLAMLQLPDPTDTEEDEDASTEHTELRTDNALGTYLILRPCQLRETAEFSSEATGGLQDGLTVEVLETAVNSDGTTRLRTANGWLSEYNRSGDRLVQQVASSATGPASQTPAPMPESKPVWSTSSRGPDVVISDSDRSAHRTSGDSWGVALGAQEFAGDGIQSFKWKVTDSHMYAWVGVASPDVPLSSGPSAARCRFGIAMCCDGEVKVLGEGHVGNSEGFGDGDTMECRIDFASKSVTFLKDGNTLYAHQSTSVSGPLCPYVTLGTSGTKVTILDSSTCAAEPQPSAVGTCMEAIPVPAERLLKESQKDSAKSTGYLTTGSMTRSIMDAENAAAIFYARMIVADALHDPNAELSPTCAIPVLRRIFAEDTQQPSVHRFLHTPGVHHRLTLPQVDTGIKKWLAAAPGNVAAVLDDVLHRLDQPMPKKSSKAVTNVPIYPSFEAHSVQTAGPGVHTVANGVFELRGGSSGDYTMCVCRVPFPPTGTHTIKVDVQAMSDCAGIGVVKSFEEAKEHRNGSKAWIGNGPAGWCLFNDGDCCHNGSWNSGSQRFGPGRTVAITISSDGKFTCEVNGSRREAYHNLPSPVYFAVAMQQSGRMKLDVSGCGSVGGDDGAGQQTELELDKQPPKPYGPHALWMLRHCVACGAAEIDAAAAVSHRLLELWAEVPAAARVSTIASLARMPAPALSQQLDKPESVALIEQVIEAAVNQHAMETKGTLRLNFSSYFCDLLEILHKSSAHCLLPQVEDSGAAAAFKTVWSQTLHGRSIVIEEDELVARQTDDGTTVYSHDPLPEHGQHYFEITMSRRGREKGRGMGGCYFIGVVRCDAVGDGSVRSVYSTAGSWGLEDNAGSALRANGTSTGSLPREQQNPHGRAYGNDDCVGVMVDMDSEPRTLQFYRDGILLEGASVSGFPADVRIAACPYNSDVRCTLAFPDSDASPPASAANTASSGLAAAAAAATSVAGTGAPTAAPAPVTVDTTLVNALVEFGFSPAACRRAAVATAGQAGRDLAMNVEIAVAWLVEHSDDPGLNDTEEQGADQTESASEPAQAAQPASESETKPGAVSEAVAEPEPEPEADSALSLEPDVDEVSAARVSSLWPETESRPRKAFRKTLCSFQDCCDMLEDVEKLPDASWWDEKRPSWRAESDSCMLELEQVRGVGLPSSHISVNSVSFENFETVAVSRPVTSGKMFYEIEVAKVGNCPQFGWATTTFDLTIHRYCGEGVGDDGSSWGIDGARQCKWFRGSTPWGEHWADGDTIGCAADLSTGELRFGRNGQWDAPMGLAFTGVQPEGGLFPAFTASSPTQVCVNFGAKPWSYGPPDDSYTAFALREAEGREADDEEERSQTDWGAAFAPTWTLEMDAALIQYATERAAVKGKRAVEDLRLVELLDPVVTSDTADTAADESLAPDQVALRRGVSVAPSFELSSYAEPTPRRQDQPRHLSDNKPSSIRARWVLLKAYNAIIKPALKTIDLRQYESEDHVANRLCRAKGRLLPSTKAYMLETSVRLTNGGDSVPEITVHLALPGTTEAASVDTVFEQCFQRLYPRHRLTSSRREGSEAQLWKVRMEGAGATALWTDQTDAGGMFRASIRSLCSDLQQPPRQLPNGQVSVPLLITTPNFAFGGGAGDDALEKWVPNPRSVTEDDLHRFRFLGVLMGASCRTSGFMELDIAPLVWKFILGEKTGLHDIAAVDTRVAAHLEKVAAVETPDAWEVLQGVDAICWSVQLANGSVVALRGDGSEEVKYEDALTFVADAESRWFKQFERQLEALRDGFFATFPELATRLLTWRELERRVCGFPDVSVDALKRIARYEGPYNEADPYIAQMWDALRSLTGAERKQFLGFVWGRGRLPAQPTQPFTIDAAGGGDESLPRSHTCMFQLHLPRYSSAAILKQRLLVAIQNAGSQTNTTTSVPRGSGVEPEVTSSRVQSACVLQTVNGGGHKEDLGDFARRSGLGENCVAGLQVTMRIKNMAELIEKSAGNNADFVNACHRLLTARRLAASTHDRLTTSGQLDRDFVEPSLEEVQALRADVSARLGNASGAQQEELEILLRQISSECGLHESRRKAELAERAKTQARLAKIDTGQKAAPTKAPTELSFGAHVMVEGYGPATVTKIRADGSIAVRYDADGATWSRVQPENFTLIDPDDDEDVEDRSRRGIDSDEGLLIASDDSSICFSSNGSDDVFAGYAGEDAELELEDGELPSVDHMMERLFSMFSDSGRMGFEGVRHFFQACQEADSDSEDDMPLEDMPLQLEAWHEMCEDFGVDAAVGMDRVQFERLLDGIRDDPEELWDLYRRIAAQRGDISPVPQPSVLHDESAPTRAAVTSSPVVARSGGDSDELFDAMLETVEDDVTRAASRSSIIASTPVAEQEHGASSIVEAVPPPSRRSVSSTKETQMEPEPELQADLQLEPEPEPESADPHLTTCASQQAILTLVERRYEASTLIQRIYRGRIARTDVACIRSKDEALHLCKQMRELKEPDAAVARLRLAAVVRLADGGGPGKLTKVALQVLCKQDVPALVLQALKAHIGDVGVAEHGCHALRVLTRSNDTAATLGNEQAVDQVLDCLSKHHAVHGVAEQACSALVNLTNHSTAKSILARGQPTASSHIVPVLTALRSHPLSPAVLDPGFAALKLLDKHVKHLRKDLVAGDAIALAVAALKAHPRDADVTMAVCQLLIGFATDRDTKAKAEHTKTMVRAGAVGALVEALKSSAGEFTCKRGLKEMTERDKGGVLAVHVRAIWALVAASKSPEVKLAIVELEGIEALAAAMKDFPESDTLSYNACCVLWILINDPKRPDDRVRFVETDGVGVVVRSMEKHRNSLQQQEAGCGVIMTLAMSDDAGQAAIKAAGGIDALGLAMAAHPDCGKLHHNVSLALEHMKEQRHAEDAAAAVKAAMALEEARRCWPRGA